MHTSKSYYRFTLGAAFALLIAGCGGGGGGDIPATTPPTDSGGGGGGISSTTPAAITASNGKQIASDAFVGGSLGTEVGTLFASATTPAGEKTGGTPSVTTVVQTLLGAVNKADLSTSHQPSLSRAIQTESDTITGGCGGSAGYTVRSDDVTGDFNGTFTFNNYCEEGETVNGAMSMSGTGDPIEQMTMTFSSLSFSSGSDSVVMDGAIAVNITSTTSTAVTVNIKMKDNSTSKVFWIENYVATINTVIGGEEIDISGRFYNPDYGYVDLSTPTHLFFAGSDEWPSAGVMVATGANSSKVKLTAISNTTYNYEVDANGDGVYETQQLGQLWADL